MFDQEAFISGYNTIATVFYALLVIIVLISFIIIYGTFNLIMNERIPVIGTFLSQGATEGKVKFILYMESVGYGIMGGIIGDLLGILFLIIISNAYSPLGEYGVMTDISIHPIYLVIGFLFSVVLSFLSAYMPVCRIKKMSVKDIILDNLSNAFEIGNAKAFVGVIFVAISLVGYLFEGKWTYDYSIILLLLSISGLILVYPKCISLITNLFCKALWGRNEMGYLAFHNVRSSKVLLGNINLIMIALLTTIIITSASKSILDFTNEAYEEMNYDLQISNILESYDDVSTTDKIIKELEHLGYIQEESINPFVHVEGAIQKTNIMVIGVKNTTFDKYMEYLDLDTGQNKKVYEAFKEDKYKVILSDTLISEINKNEEDTVSIKVNDINRQFKIAGSINGKLYDNGIFVIMNRDTMKEVFNIKEAGSITVNTLNDPNDVRAKLNKIAKKYGATVSTREQDVAESLENSESTSQIFAVFTYIAICIAAIGIINNMLISYMQRKKELAIFISVGMNAVKVKMMMVLEAILSVFWAAIIILPYSKVILRILSKFIMTLGVPMDITLSVTDFPKVTLLFLAGVGIALTPTLIKSRKLSVIQEIRME